MKIDTAALKRQVDHELREPLEFVTGTLGVDFMSTLDAPGRRARFREFLEDHAAPGRPFPDVTRHDLHVPGYLGDPDVPVRVFRREDRRSVAGGVLYIHGGGFTLGSAEGEDANAAALAAELGCTVISVDYRLAPEHPYPAQIRDCYAALQWISANAASVLVDASLIAVYGHSAGGNLAANLALMARDLKGPAIAYQVLCYPLLDDRMQTSSMTMLSGLGLWDRAANAEAWRSLLGDEYSGAPPDYAVPARATDLSQLPPAYIDTGALEILLDENLEFAGRLAEAGVPLELHIYPGAYHGFDMFAPKAAVSQRAIAARHAAIGRALKLATER